MNKNGSVDSRSVEDEERMNNSQTSVKTKSPLGVKFALWSVFFAVLILLGMFVGIRIYPGGYKWLVNHNFITQNDQEKLKEKVIDKEVVKVRSEESVVTSVVDKSMGSVVSIAVEPKDIDENNIAESDLKVNIGSGFVVSSDGLIATNQHVVSNPDVNYIVISNDNKVYHVKKILRDNSNDIALLKIDSTNLKPLPLIDSSSTIKPGQLVIAIGTPLGEFAGTVTTGVVSGVNRSVKTSPTGFWENSREYYNVIQTDAAINPGNSGGPLLNSSGEVIGINFATTSMADNISFALPVDILKRRIDEYHKYGKFLRPFLGVKYRIISSYIAQYYPVLTPGAYVVAVVPGSPADKGGLQEKDIITEIEGKKVSTSLQGIIDLYSPGDTVKIKVFRDGKDVELSVKLGTKE